MALTIKNQQIRDEVIAKKKDLAKSLTANITALKTTHASQQMLVVNMRNANTNAALQEEEEPFAEADIAEVIAEYNLTNAALQAEVSSFLSLDKLSSSGGLWSIDEVDGSNVLTEL